MHDALIWCVKEVGGAGARQVRVARRGWETTMCHVLDKGSLIVARLLAHRGRSSSL